MAILCSVCVADDKFCAAVLHGDRGAPVKDFGKAADAVPVIGAVLGLAFKAVILDRLDFLDSMFLLTASAGEFLKVIGGPSLKGVKRKAIIAPAPDGDPPFFLLSTTRLDLENRREIWLALYRLLNSTSCMM